MLLDVKKFFLNKLRICNLHVSTFHFKAEPILAHVAHLFDAFCSTEWLRSDSRRTAVGLDFDVDALNWCLENNVNKVGGDVYSRLSLFHGNVLQPLDASLVKCETQDLIRNVSLEDIDGSSEVVRPNSNLKGSPSAVGDEKFLKDSTLPARDIVCAFNYSCCCLHSRQELVSYFKYALGSLSRKGGIFVMDLYGGTSSECELRMQRKFPNFTVCSSCHNLRMF